VDYNKNNKIKISSGTETLTVLKLAGSGPH